MDYPPKIKVTYSNSIGNGQEYQQECFNISLQNLMAIKVTCLYRDPMAGSHYRGTA